MRFERPLILGSGHCGGRFLGAINSRVRPGGVARCYTWIRSVAAARKEIADTRG